MPVMRIALVGCGNISKTHAAAAAELPNVEISACTDLIPERAENFAQTFGIPRVFDTMEAMLKADAYDLVLLATFPANHLAEIQQAVALGARAILCEKALAMSGEQGDAIQQLVQETGVFLVEGLMYRQHPQIQQAKHLIDSGAIGEVGLLQAQFSSYTPPDPSNWRNNRSLGGGSMAAKGVYLIDAFNFFAGHRLKSVFCAETLHPETQIEIGVNATLVYDGCLVGQFNSNHYTAWREDIKIVGREGTIIIPHAIVSKKMPRWIELQIGGAYEDAVRKIERFEFEPYNSYKGQLANIYACLFEGAVPLVPLSDSVYNLHVTSALLQSAAIGQAVAFDYQKVS